MSENFKNLVSVSYMGQTIVLANKDTDDFSRNDVYFNVLDLKVESANDHLDWTGFQKVTFTEQLRPVGMSIITLDQTDNFKISPSDSPFRVATDQKFISIFRQSTYGTIYVNRFKLVSKPLPRDPNILDFSLQPAWEVRFERSGKQDIPANNKDTQKYLSPEKTPFLEPTLELSMMKSIERGQFNVVLLPVMDSTSYHWQFCAYNNKKKKIDLYNIPADENGLFDLSKNIINDKNEIVPDNSFAIKVELTEKNVDFNIVAAPTASFYTKQEKVVGTDGETSSVKRSGRYMLALAGSYSENTANEDAKAPNSMALLDLSVSANGKLANIPQDIIATKLSEANYTLAFNEFSYISLKPTTSTNPLEIKGAFDFSTWLFPESSNTGKRFIIGNLNEGIKSAPYLALVDGAKLEVGFGDGTKVVSVQTVDNLLSPDSWFKIDVSYGGVGENPFAIRINQSIAKISDITVSSEPAGAALDSIGSDVDGFAGLIEETTIKVGYTDICKFNFNNVNYTNTPPTTENSVKNAIVSAEVYGATLVPSNCPLVLNTTGRLYIDKNNLSVYAGVADFINPVDSPFIMEGSDGLLHLYYANESNNDFAVAHYSLNTARTSFYSNWKAELLNEEDSGNQSGIVRFIASRAGSYFNKATIKIENSFSERFCNLKMTDTTSGLSESWKGVPRSLESFIAVLNGEATNSPDDNALNSRNNVFFDYEGVYRSVWVPAQGVTNAGDFVFISRYNETLPLASVAVIDNNSSRQGTVNVELSIKPFHWKDNSEEEKIITQSWKSVPDGAQEFANILNGSSSSYDYSDTDFSNCEIIYLNANQSLKAEASNRITIYSLKKIIKSFKVEIQGAGQTTCDVTVTVDNKSYKLPNVDREQNKIAKLLNGEIDTYSYPKKYKENVAHNIVALTDGLLASVYNQTGQQEVNNMLAGAMLFSLFYTGNIYSGARIKPITRTIATIEQQGKNSNADNNILLDGSELFTIVEETQPSNGAVAYVLNTEPDAAIFTQGADGGWIKEPNRFALSFNQSQGNSNYLNYDVSKDNINSEVLAISGDLSLEAWGKPVSPSTGEIISKLLNYNVLGNVDVPDRSLQYSMGFKSWYVPSFRASTAANTSIIINDGTANDLTLHGFVNIDSSASNKGDVFGLTTNLNVKEYVSLSSTPSGNLTVSFLGKKLFDDSVTTNIWISLGLTLQIFNDSTVTIALYVDGKKTKEQNSSFNFSDNLGTLFAGSYLSGSGLQMKINQLSLWPKVLDEVSMMRLSESGVSSLINPPLICLNLNDGPDTDVAKNSSYLGSEYDGAYKNIDPSYWSYDDSIFMSPFASNGTEALIATTTGCKSWTHSAFVFRQGFSLDVYDNNFVDCGNDSSLNILEKSTIEAWIKPSNEPGRYRILAAKGGSYMLGLYPDGTAFFNIAIETDKKQKNLSVKAKSTIAASATGYIAVTTEIKALQEPYDPKEPNKPSKLQYAVYLNIYINGVLSASFSKEDFDDPVQTVESDSNMYLCGTPDLNQMYSGQIGEVRFWNRDLSATEVSQIYSTHLPPAKIEGLISYWRFSEMKGKTAFDNTDLNNATISNGELWRYFPEIATTKLYINGTDANAYHTSVSDLGGYGDQDRFTIGGAINSGSIKYELYGGIDEVRVWDIQLTQEQISDSLYRTLSGSETGLKGYWRFDNGSGLEVKDQTGRNNNGEFSPPSVSEGPQWISSDAPISNEASVVYNALNGIKTLNLASILGQPSVIEYGDIQVDAYGNVFSVMKRAYIYLDKNTNRQVLFTGYKIGDLDTIYLGQVQTKPSIVGFIEGAPPIPSENQTSPYWDESPAGSGSYGESTSISMTEASDVTYSFSASKSDGFNVNLAGKIGVTSEGTFETSAGIGAEAETTVFEYEVSGGLQASLSSALSDSEELSLQNQTSLSKVSSFQPGGSWESIDEIVNKAVGLRYLTDNTGIAIVKSGAADLYMIAIKGRNTPVRYSLVPNNDIPEDMNIIPFPIDNTYIKNGTLDGKVGLKNDPNYPDADLVRGSYFKPIEAYALKRKIERKESELEGFYQQFNTEDKMTLDEFKDEIGNNPAFNWSKKISNRNIVNTYVWSASGATYSEQTSVMDTYSENFSGTKSLEIGGGIFAAGKIKKPVGPMAELDLMLSTTMEKTVTKSKESSQSFSLECSVNPDNTLNAPIVSNDSGKPKLDGYSSELAPGKVDNYRYQAFYLTPSTENFQTLQNTVIDPYWINNSVDSNAAALRQAYTNENGCWRILYRVTFVGRVPAKFQPVNAETLPPDIEPPANLKFNIWITQIIEKQIAKENPGTEEIGSAVSVVLGKDKNDTGELGILLPWWNKFIDAASTYGSKEYREFIELREDVLQYMIEKYQSEQV